MITFSGSVILAVRHSYAIREGYDISHPMVDPPFSSGTIAKACEYALRFRLIDYHAIRCWGDELILSLDSPPTWAIDLSDCTVANVDERLRRVPGKPNKDEWECLLCGLLSIRWRLRKLTIGTMRGIGWTLYIDEHFQDTSHWGLELECVGEGYDDGYGTLQQLEASVKSMVDSFAEYEPLVPRWLAESRAEPDDPRELPIARETNG